MDDRLDPVFFYWMIRYSEANHIYALDIYDRYDDVYYHWDEGGEVGRWDGAAGFMRAGYIAEMCMISFDNGNNERLGWMTVILDGGYPRLHDCSVGNIEDLTHQASLVSEAVATGNISMLKILDGSLNPINITKEITNA
jgi:hypothetical protein